MPLTRSEEALSQRNRANASNPHHNTPQKARIREAAFQLRTNGNWNGIYNLNGIFERQGVSKTRGYAILRENLDSDRTFPQEEKEETRGRPKKIPQAKIWVMEAIIEQADVQEPCYELGYAWP